MKFFKSLTTLTLAALVMLAFLPMGRVSAARIEGGWNSPLEPMPGVSTGFLVGCGNGIYIDSQFHIGNDLSAAVGSSVKAIGGGTVKYAGSFGLGNGNAIFVQHKAGNGTDFVALYGHVDVSASITTGSQVVAGQQIASIASIQNSDPHLHLGIRPGTTYPASNWGMMPCPSPDDGSRNTNGFVDPLPFLSAHPVTSGSSRMVITNSGGEVWAKDGINGGGWLNQSALGSTIRVNGTKMVLINSAGQVYAKEGLNTGGWIDQGAQAQDVQVSSTGRLILINAASQVYAKDGISPGGWIDQGAQAAKIRANGNRIAIINAAGQVFAKDSVSGGGWYNQAVNAKDVQISSTGRMAILNAGDQVWAKDHLGAGGWLDQGANAKAISVNGDRMVLLNSGNQIWAKDGLGTGGWLDQGALAQDVQISPAGRLMLINSAGQIYAKDGLGNGGWIDQGAIAVQFVIG